MGGEWGREADGRGLVGEGEGCAELTEDQEEESRQEARGRFARLQREPGAELATGWIGGVCGIKEGLVQRKGGSARGGELGGEGSGSSALEGDASRW